MNAYLYDDMKQETQNCPEGFLLINKPVGASSFSCVMHVKKLLSRGQKIGHAGTLDPFAQGLLIIGVGRGATCKMEALIQLDKRYTVTAQLGVETDTHDHTGMIVNQQDVSAISQEQIQDAINLFVPSYVQTPPIFSALKHQGLPLYKYARARRIDEQTLSAIVTAKSRRIYLYQVILKKFERPYFTLEAHVSHGTYIRSLISDIAKHVHVAATAHSLSRVAIGPFDVSQAITIDMIKTREDVEKLLLPIESFLGKLPKLPTTF